MTTLVSSFSKVSWFAPIGVALLCWGLWCWEWQYWVPQEEYAWTEYHWKAIYPIIGLTIGVFLWPLHQAFAMPWKWVLFYALLLCGMSWGTYYMAHSIFQHLYLEGLLGGNSDLAAWSLWKLLGLALSLAICYFIPLWHYHQTTDGMHILTLVEVFILVIPCSLISLELLPMGTTEITFMNAVKLGYPVFWTPIGLGYLSRAIALEWV